MKITKPDIDLKGASGYCPFRNIKISECKGKHILNAQEVTCSYAEGDKCGLGKEDSGGKR